MKRLDLPEQLIHQLFEAQAATRPDATALTFEDRTLSYNELNRRANRVAHALLALGVRPDDRIAICVERGFDMIIGLLGVLKAGAAYVPLDPAYPRERLAYLLADSQPCALLTQTALRQQLPAEQVPVVVLDDRDSATALASLPTHNPDPASLGVTPRHLAYVIYTSGSTGMPKGVMNHHGGLVNLAQAQVSLFNVTPESRVLQFASFSFDASVWEIVMALSNGACLSLASRDALQPGEPLLTLLKRAHITHLTLPPSVLTTLAEDTDLAPMTLIVAGESCAPELARRWANRHRLFNAYGPTETTVCATIHPCRADHVGDRVPIGRPIANLSAYVLDPRRQPVPIGVAGEIYIGGIGVARGYLNRPELAAVRFVPDPFSTQAGAKLYRTGDLGRYRKDGTIEFLGRNDFQIKLRGFRIEPGEIEAQLLKATGVREAVVVAHEDKRLVAYVAAQDGAELSTAALRAHLLPRLPEHMVPNAFVILERLPLTPNGKIDRKALPAPDASALVTRLYEAPQGKIERAIAEIWQDLLDVSSVGRQDHFFELGGHSLLAVTLIERLREQGWCIDVRTVFDAPTLAGLAAAMTSAPAIPRVLAPPNPISADCTHITPALLPLVSLTQTEIDAIVANVSGGVSNIQDIYPLTPLQEGLLFHHLLETDADDVYLSRAVLAFANRSRLDDFLAALQIIIDRHDILRSSVHWDGLYRPVQVVHRRARLLIEALPPVDSGQVLAQLLALTNPRGRDFNLQRAPLLSAYLAADPLSESCYLALLFHHLVVDHITLEIMIGETQKLLAGQADSLATPFPYRHFVAQALAVSVSGHETFFRKQLSDVDAPTAPFGILVKSSDAGFEIDPVTVPLSETLAQRVRRVARQSGVSPAVLFHAAWAQVVARCSGRDDVVFGTVLSGRLQGAQGADPLVGILLNTLPIRLLLAGRSVQQIVQETHRRLSELLEHELAPLPLAQRCSGVAPPLPLFTTLLNYRHSSATGTATAWDGIQPIRIDERTHYPFTISVDDFGQGFALTVQCEVIDPSRIAGYLQTAMEGLIEALEHTPQRPIGTINILSPSEREQLLVGFNNTAVDYPRDRLIQQLFEVQVERSPTAMAAICDGHELTYHELNRRANQLAHHFIAQGIRPDDRVAICVERGLDMVVGLLGILKAGAAYVPLDPSYPIERLQFMLEDSAPVGLLTQASLKDRLPRHTLPVVAIDTDTTLAQQSHDNPDPTVLGLTDQHLAYVIYTSGSTGAPKGVAIEHRNTVNLIRWARSAFTEKELAHTVFSTSLNFDLAVYECFVPLSIGAVIDIRHDLLALASAPSRVITLINTVPSAIQALLDHQGIPDTIHTINLAGEPLKQTLVDRLFGETRVKTVCNLYGPSETTTYSTWVAMDQEQGFAAHIGRPIANTRIYILDAHRQPVPMGVVGELYIGGAGVARGYLNRPDLTAERFLPDPFVADPEARIYKTGDLARHRPNGDIEFLGRNDFQVKIRGFRIELGEIETQLLAYPGIRDAIVIAREDSPGDRRLVAYLTTHDHPAVSIAALREHLASRLPIYMVPNAFVVLPRLPLTPNGKIDRPALPAPDVSAGMRRAYEPPQGDFELAIATVWQDLLGVSSVGRHDNFFELGGHSLLAMQLIVRLRQLPLLQQSRLRVDLKSVFASPTVVELAATIAGTGATPTLQIPANRIPGDCTCITPDLLPLVTLTQTEIDRLIAIIPEGLANIQDIYPLSPMQEGLLFHHLLESEGDPYLLRSVVAFASQTKLDAFLAALQAVIDRHDILRSSIHWRDLSRPVQVVHRRSQLSRNQLAVATTNDELAQLLQHTNPRHRRLDLQRAPLLEAYTAADPQSGEYYLALLYSHLVIDHVTLEAIIAEIHTLLAGRSDVLPAPLPYRHFVAQALAVPASEHAAYFRQQLGDVDEPTAPFGILNVRRNGTQIKEATVALSESLSRRLRDSARQEGVTPGVLFHVAWAQVLAACSGRQDVVFGTLLLGRSRDIEGVDRTLGVFINTLPIRLSLSGLTVRKAIAVAYQRISELLAHEHASLALVQRYSQVMPPLPLFTTLLNYRHSHPQPAATMDGMRIIAGEERTNYPFTISVDEFPTGFSVTVQCEGVEPARIVGYLHTVIDGLVEALENTSQRPLDTLSILPATERAQLLTAFNDTVKGYPRHSLIHQLVETQVQKTPTATAVVCNKQSLTYRELNQRANQLAHHLIEHGIRPDDRVAVCIERGVEMVIGLLGILKAGAAYVPIDPCYPIERLAFMLADSAPSMLLTQATRRQRLPVGKWPTLMLDDPVFALQPTYDPDPVALGLTASHLAYVIYTSGSTGKPKGVAMEHQALMNLLHWQHRSNAYSCPRTAQFAALGFDVAFQEIFSTIGFGGELVLIPDDDIRRDSSALAAFLGAQQIERLFIPFSALKPLAHAIVEQQLALPTLQAVITAGEQLRIEPMIQQCFRQLRSCRLYNHYGPTETHVATSFLLVEQVNEWTALPPIGRPIDNTQLYVLDRERQPVPIGVAGEIYIGGAGVARGYLNRPALTAERFVSDPYNRHADARLYRTGDLGRWRADGTLEYLGRNDFQVKIRGFRIEPGEIEAQLLACADVREAVVVARAEGADHRRLIAYVIAQPGKEIPAATLREQLNEHLPNYMVPSAFVVLEHWPLTPNGKLDRAALPAPDTSALASQPYEPPQGDIECAIASVWQTLLQVPQVGRYDDFFALGGHSLLAVQLVARLRPLLDREIPLRDVFAHPTLIALARAIGNTGAAKLPPLPHADRTRSLPLSFAQQRLWELIRQQPKASTAYHRVVLLRLHGPVNVSALQMTLDCLAARHESLRTRFVEVDGQLVQCIDDVNNGLRLQVEDWHEVPASKRTDVIADVGHQALREPFDFAKGPLMRARLLRLADQEHVLLLAYHFIICDGWSSKVLLRESAPLYAAFVQGQSNPLPPPPWQFADFASWQRHWAASTDAQPHLDFWIRHLTGAPARLALPTDRPWPTVPSFAGASLPFALSPKLTEQLRHLAQDQGATLYMILIAGWAALMGHLSDQTDVVIGSATANRPRQEWEELVGLCVNTLALRVQLDDGLTGIDLLAQVKAAVLAAYVHQHLPFERIVQALARPVGSTLQPLFQTMLTLNNAPVDGVQAFSGLTVDAIVPAQFTSRCELNLGLNDDGAMVSGSLSYSTELFEAATMENIADQFQRLLESLATAPYQRIVDWVTGSINE
ncbi:MAG: amino acid adenylation domain-containing protein [Gammaproteobacteria bacterium]|nr:amino acid adenylation domain-containing protein [Gammaproteobacteria bacterium]